MAMTHLLDRSFLKQFKTFAVRVLSNLNSKDTRLRLIVLKFLNIELHIEFRHCPCASLHVTLMVFLCNILLSKPTINLLPISAKLCLFARNSKLFSYLNR